MICLKVPGRTEEIVVEFPILFILLHLLLVGLLQKFEFVSFEFVIGPVRYIIKMNL